MLIIATKSSAATAATKQAAAVPLEWKLRVCSSWLCLERILLNYFNRLWIFNLFSFFIFSSLGQCTEAVSYIITLRQSATNLSKGTAGLTEFDHFLSEWDRAVNAASYRHSLQDLFDNMSCIPLAVVTTLHDPGKQKLDENYDKTRTQRTKQQLNTYTFVCFPCYAHERFSKTANYATKPAVNLLHQTWVSATKTKAETTATPALKSGIFCH